MRLFLILSSFILLTSCAVSTGQSKSVISIKDFGAKGNGYTNDTEAFIKAAKYINKRGGNCTLNIPNGNYIVGRQQIKQLAGGKKKILQEDILVLKNCNNVKIIGSSQATIKYANGLKFGSFNPNTLLKHPSKNGFANSAYAVNIGVFIYLINSTNIELNNIECNGNNSKAIIGGKYGDKGIQLWHYGVIASNCTNVQVKNVNMHHFCLDGMKIVNTNSTASNNIVIRDSHFDYNGRQGLSWIGGNGLKVYNSTFDHTGKAGVASSPGAGLDIEPHGKTTLKNGYFKDCSFTNNYGAGLVADGGNNSNQLFEDCTFWGTTNWSVWVRNPKFTFKKCNFYGAFTHGYKTTDWNLATKFIQCNFEDKKYNNKVPYFGMLTNIRKVSAMLFQECTFTSNLRRNVFVQGSGSAIKPLFDNCVFNIKNQNLPNKTFYAKIVNCQLKNCTFNERYKSFGKNYFLYQGRNTDKGGNNIPLKYRAKY